MTPLSAHLSDVLDREQSAILVTIAAVHGSTPRSTDAAMIVTERDCFGTIGGGELEWRAEQQARNMLETGLDQDRSTMILGPESGQCCGGRVDLLFERANGLTIDHLIELERAAENANPSVVIFGAGHVGRALAVALDPLPLNVSVFDTRPSARHNWPDPSILSISAIPESAIVDAKPGTVFLILTHDHALDFVLTEAALRRGDAAYVGLIGSKTKRRRFERYFVNNGGDPALLDQLVSPIGSDSVRDKRPAVIAALVASQILEQAAIPANQANHEKPKILASETDAANEGRRDDAQGRATSGT